MTGDENVGNKLLNGIKCIQVNSLASVRVNWRGSEYFMIDSGISGCIIYP